MFNNQLTKILKMFTISSVKPVLVGCSAPLHIGNWTGRELPFSWDERTLRGAYSLQDQGSKCTAPHPSQLLFMLVGPAPLQSSPGLYVATRRSFFTGLILPRAGSEAPRSTCHWFNCCLINQTIFLTKSCLSVNSDHLNSPYAKKSFFQGVKLK